MTLIEFDALRLRCRAALDAHHAHLVSIIESSKGGVRPPLGERHAEELALYELAKARREFLDAFSKVYPPSP